MMKVLSGFAILVITVSGFFSCQKEVEGSSQRGQGTTGTTGTVSLDSTYLKEYISLYVDYFTDTVSVEKYNYDNLKRLTSVTVIKVTPFLAHPAQPTADKDTMLFFYEGNSMRVQKAIRKIKTWNFTWTPNHISNPVLGTQIQDIVDTLKFTYDNSGQVINDTVVYGFNSPLVDIYRYLYVPNEVKAYGQSISNGISTGEILTTYSLTFQGPNLVSQNKNGLIDYQMQYDNMKSPFNRVQPAYSFRIPKLWFTNMFWSFNSAKNNIRDLTTYVHSSGSPVPTVYNTQFAYTYRTDGYPLSLSRTGYISLSDYFNKAVFLYYQ